jgi:uncharacterized protein (DUF362 family)
MDSSTADCATMLGDPLVAISRGSQQSYPKTSPFHPAEAFPELSRLRSLVPLDPGNQVYGCVRESLKLLGLDAGKFGSVDWNPFGAFIRPGDRVLVKPNWVAHKHESNDSWEQVITHGAVIRPVVDYVQLALEGRGAITVADGPMLGSDFSEICRRTGVDELKRHYDAMPGAVPLELLDLRSVFNETLDAVVVKRHALAGDPRGAVRVDLGRNSALYGFRGEGRYYGADYDTEEVNEHHRGDVQEYQLSGTAIAADVIIDVPKLKSHHKVGITLALKGVVGLNCGRNWLPHRTQGTPATGGDQFQASGLRQQAESVIVRTFEQTSLQFPRTVPTVYRLAKRIGKHVFGASHRTIRGGGWHGNDTLWRMVHDINRALMYADSSGRLHQTPVRQRFCVVDGIVAGEGMGPTSPDPRPCGVVLSGRNAVAVDVIGAELMGFDYQRIPQLAHAFSEHPLPLAGFGADRIAITSNAAGWSGGLDALRDASPFAFTAPLGWGDYLERRPASQPFDRQRRASR